MTDPDDQRGIAMSVAALSERGTVVQSYGGTPRSESACVCPPSWRHLPECPLVRDDEEDA